MTSRAFLRASALRASLAAAAAIGLSGCGSKAPMPAGTPVQQVGAWRIAVANSPDPAHVGSNTLVIAARDSLGGPMPGDVEAMVSMPAMGAMPRMESRGIVSPAGHGIWRAKYGLPMSGEWDVTIRLLPRPGPPADAQYRISTSVRGLSFSGGTVASAPAASEPPMPISPTGEITLDAERRQALGIRTAPVEARELSASVRVPGRVAYDEARQADVTVKFGGYVRELVANITGAPVRKGQVLFKVYSPELWSAQQEFIEALRASNSDRSNPALGSTSADLARAARERLLLWDLSPADLDEIARTGAPSAAFPMRSPLSGVVVEKSVVSGSAFQPGQVLFRIAQLDPIWVIASVSQADLGQMRVGMGATISDPYVSSAARHGRVEFVYPSVDSLTRTGQVRISVANPGGRLQPGTYVNVDLSTAPTRSLAIPEGAVLPTGERYVVFVDVGGGRLTPREVQIGRHANGYYEVLGGLSEGDVVVVSGNFLVGAESTLRSATEKW